MWRVASLWNGGEGPWASTPAGIASWLSCSSTAPEAIGYADLHENVVPRKLGPPVPNIAKSATKLSSEALPVCDRGLQGVHFSWEGEVMRLWHIKREGRQRGWWVSFFLVPLHLMTWYVDQLWRWPHRSRIKMCCWENCGNICVILLFCILISLQPPSTGGWEIFEC